MYKWNKYDRLIIFIIASYIFGTVQFGIITQSVVVGLFCIPYAIREFMQSKKNECRSISFFFKSWFLYAAISLLWTIDSKGGYPDLWGLGFNMVIFFSLLYATFRAEAPIRSFMTGWLVLLLLTYPVAIWEFTTSNHIAKFGDFNETDAENFFGQMDRRFAAVTYKNLNSYVTLLCMALPVSISSIFYFSKKLIPAIITVVAVVVVLLNASRGGLLCVIADSFVFLFFYNKIRFKHKFLVSIFLFFLIITFVFYFGFIIVQQLSLRLVDEDLMVDANRHDLIICGINLLFQSVGIGYGVGSMQEAYSTMPVFIHYAHNMIVEFLVEYGIFLFIPFVILFYNSLVRLCKSNIFSIKLFGFTVFASIVPCLILDDTYFAHPYVWGWMATIFSISSIINYRR